MANISSIAANLPFIDTLASGLLDKYGNDPLIFSNITILLPNRRACKALAEAFLRISGGKPMLLPQIQPLGDFDEDEQIFKIPNGNNEIPNIISSTQQRLILTQLIEKWQNTASSSDKITTPQAANLAIELASFLGEVEKEQLSFAQIKEIVPDELSKHWQVTLNFLSILIDKWPDILQQYDCVDIHTQRNISLKIQAEYWQKNPSQYPVIAAGSTGSIPATAELLKVIANMELGELILPGLDKIMDDTSWQLVEQTHPQFGMKQLLEHIGIKRNDVNDYCKTIKCDINRCDLLSQVMLPASATDQWHKMSNINSLDLQGIELISAPTMQNEATIIAMQMKQMLQSKGKTAALITNQRNLAKRVASILHKWDIAIDDSAGQLLSDTPQAVFLRLLAQMVTDNLSNPISLLNCLKHPYAACGLHSKEFRDNVRKLEMATLRGVRKNDGLDGFYSQINGKLANWLKNVASTLEPMTKLMQLNQVPFDEMLKRHLKVSEEFASTDSDSGANRLWHGSAGEQLKKFIDELLLSAQKFKHIDPTEYAGLFEAMLAGQSYRQPYGTHPRLFILSPIEARMLRFDLVILGGVNEGSWPMTGKADPWMSRPMRDNFGLPLPEKKIGQSAHDFAQLLAAPNVVITRSEKIDGTQTIPSRWLLRLDAVLHILKQENIIKPSQPWVQWAELLNKPQTIKACEPPEPNPPIDARPKKLSVTSIEKLMRDPYSIYASKILRLKALEPIDKDPSGAEFGNFVHDVLEVFVNKYNEIEAGSHLNYLLELGQKILKEQKLKPAITSFWWPRFERIAAWFVENEELRRQDNIAVYSEVLGEHVIEFGNEEFVLQARADRLELSENGQISLIDYKTGVVPSSTDVKLGLSPQMTLEGVIADHGGFAHKGQTTALQYWKLSGNQNIAEVKNAGYRKNDDVEKILADACLGIESLINTICYDNNPFLSCPNKDKAPAHNDYEHLARLKEWSE